MVVKWWSNGGQMVVKWWSNGGQMVVKWWSNGDFNPLQAQSKHNISTHIIYILYTPAMALFT
jgi:hypothetical protein